MAQHDLKPGDQVQLVSGGPVMTLARDGTCYWFEKGELRFRSLPPEVLRPYQPGSGIWG